MKLLYFAVYVNEDEIEALRALLRNTAELTPDPVPSLDWDTEAEEVDDAYVCNTCKQLVDTTEVHNAKSLGCMDCDGEFCSAQCQTEHCRKMLHNSGYDAAEGKFTP